MNIIGSHPNHTYAVLNLNEDRFISIKDNLELIGFLGKLIDDLLIKKHLRKCKLIGGPILGERLDNGTWTGNLGLIQRKEAISYLKSEPPLIDASTERWMYYLFPFYREKFVIFQEIGNDINKESYKEKNSNVLNCFNFDLTFLFLFLFTNLLSFSIWILLKLLTEPNNIGRILIKEKIKYILTNYLNFYSDLNYTKLTKIASFILFYSLYIWFIQLVVSNNIKTDKVIVDQSILIKDENDALMSKKIFCLFEGETELAIALSSNSNIIAKLYQQKNIASKLIKGININKGQRCIAKKTFEIIDTEIEDLFSILSENIIYLLASMIGRSRPDFIVWFGSKPMFEMNYHLIVSNQKDIIDKYNYIMLLYTEAGLTKRLYESFSLNSNSYFQSHIVYRTIKEFIDENSKFTDLNLESFKLLFVIYISFCLTILIINLLHYLLISKLFSQYFNLILNFIKN